MFDINEFKKNVKTWIVSHPQGDVADLIDFCEEQIPPQAFAANRWLIDQTANWYRHIIAQREIANNMESDENIS